MYVLWPQMKFLFLAARAEREPVSSYKFKKLTELKGISRAFSKKRDFQGTFAISHFPKMDPALGRMYTILIKNLYWSDLRSSFHKHKTGEALFKRHFVTFHWKKKKRS